MPVKVDPGGRVALLLLPVWVEMLEFFFGVDPEPAQLPDQLEAVPLCGVPSVTTLLIA